MIFTNFFLLPPKVNPGELIRLYHAHGYLEDAGNLALSFVEAVLGGDEAKQGDFGLDNCVRANARPVWLPYNTLDQLILELEDYSAEDPVYKSVSGTGFAVC